MSVTIAIRLVIGDVSVLQRLGMLCELDKGNALMYAPFELA